VLKTKEVSAQLLTITSKVGLQTMFLYQLCFQWSWYGWLFKGA